MTKPPLSQAQVMEAARLIVARNLTDNINAVVVQWDEATFNLTLTLYFHGEVHEADLGEGEISINELIAEFPQIRTAEVAYVSTWRSPEEISRFDGLVFLRDLPDYQPPFDRTV